ncbi:hypothetical protein BC833DRAFT_600818 [Globomyces pollinis-pini]|nr:hypothetical protein BC833DRAFT_600818 [Globomyces pollinis-pini]
MDKQNHTTIDVNDLDARKVGYKKYNKLKSFELNLKKPIQKTDSIEDFKNNNHLDTSTNHTSIESNDDHKLNETKPQFSTNKSGRSFINDILYQYEIKDDDSLKEPLNGSDEVVCVPVIEQSQETKIVDIATQDDKFVDSLPIMIDSQPQTNKNNVLEGQNIDHEKSKDLNEQKTKILNLNMKKLQLTDDEKMFKAPLSSGTTGESVDSIVVERKEVEVAKEIVREKTKILNLKLNQSHEVVDISNKSGSNLGESDPSTDAGITMQLDQVQSVDDEEAVSEISGIELPKCIVTGQNSSYSTPVREKTKVLNLNRSEIQRSLGNTITETNEVSNPTVELSIINNSTVEDTKIKSTNEATMEIDNMEQLPKGTKEMKINLNKGGVSKETEWDNMVCSVMGIVEGPSDVEAVDTKFDQVKAREILASKTDLKAELSGMEAELDAMINHKKDEKDVKVIDTISPHQYYQHQSDYDHSYTNDVSSSGNAYSTFNNAPMTHRKSTNTTIEGNTDVSVAPNQYYQKPYESTSIKPDSTYRTIGKDPHQSHKFNEVQRDFYPTSNLVLEVGSIKEKPSTSKVIKTDYHQLLSKGTKSSSIILTPFKKQ